MSGAIFRVVSTTFLNCRCPPTDKSQAEQAQSNPDQLTEPPEQCEGDAGDVGITKDTQQEHVPAVLGAEAAGDEEGAAFNKDGEGADGDGREGHSRAAQIIDNDVDFQSLRHPPKKEQPGRGIKGRTVVAIEIGRAHV